jgi:hypothetical protein
MYLMAQNHNRMPRSAELLKNSVNAKFAFWAFCDLRDTRLYRHPLLGSLAYRGGAMQEFIAHTLWAC